MRICSTLASICISIAAAAVASGAVIQKDIAAIRGDQSRALMGDGRGVIVGIVDGGIDVTHPSIRGSLIAAKDFSASGTTDDDRTDLGHATGIAGIFLGHDGPGGYTGLAPRARLVNARVVASNDYTTDAMIGTGIFWSISKGAKIINLSLGHADANPDTSKLNL